MNTLSRLRYALPAAAALVAAAAFAPTASATASPGIGVGAMPAYVGYWDTAQWNTFLASTTHLPSSVILNVASGQADFTADWQALAHKLHQKGVKILAYVPTFRGVAQKPGETAEGEIDASIDHYFKTGGVAGDTAPDGVFFDEFGTLDANYRITCAGLDLYGKVTSYAYDQIAKSAGASSFNAQTWANPGTAVASCYLGMPQEIDTFVTAENNEAGYDQYTPYNVLNADGTFSDGSAAYPSWRFAHLVWCVPAADVHAVVDRAAANYAGTVSTTDDCNATNPYDVLPSNSYLDDEVTYAASK